MAAQRSPTTESMLSGAEVRENFQAAARSFVDLTETMLGPRGMYKLVVPDDGEPVTTRDCLRVLRTVEVDHPIGRLLYGVVNDLDDQYGDGVVTGVLLSARLVDKCMETMAEAGLHARTVHDGLDRAHRIAERAVEDAAVPVDADPNDDRLRAVAETQARTKLLDGAEFAPVLAATLEALARDARPAETGGLLLDTEGRAHVFARTGRSRRATRRYDGVLVKKELLNRDRTVARDARVATVDQKLYVETVNGEEETSRTLSASSPSELEAFRRAEDAAHERLVQPLIEAGIDLLVTRKGIDDRVSDALVREGVLVVRRAKPEGIFESVAAATGGTVVGDVLDIGPADLGRAGRVEEVTFGPLEYTLVGECEGPAAVSVLTRGGTWTSAEDTERGLEAALRATAAAFREPEIVPGGGFVEVRVARALRSAARGNGTREALVLEAVAETFEAVVRTLATNAGLHGVDTLATLRARIPDETVGVVDPVSGHARVANPADAGVFEPLCVKRAAVSSALQAAMHVVPIDEVIAVE